MNSRCQNKTHRRSVLADVRSAGFTLIEVLIAFAFLAVISFTIYTTTTKAFSLREILLTEGEFYNGIRMAMNLVGRDVQMLYSPVIMLPEKKSTTAGSGTGANAAADAAAAQAEEEAERKEMEDLSATGQDRPSEFWGGMINKVGIRPSRFVGTETKVTFVSASNIRVYKESKEGDLVKVTYEVRDDPNAERDKPAKQLVRITDANVFNMEARLGNDDSDMTQTVPILQGIKGLRFEYLRKDEGKLTPFNNWDTETADLKNRYPDVVRIHLDVVGPGRLVFEGNYDFRPEIPLNGLPATF